MFSSLLAGSSFFWFLAPLLVPLWPALGRPGALSLDGAFYLAQSAFFRQSTSSWALLGVVLLALAYRSGGGQLFCLLGLASPLARPTLRAWRRSYFFNRGLANGLVLVHPLLIALAYASLIAVYLASLSPRTPPGGGHLRCLALKGARSAGAALLLGAW